MADEKKIYELSDDELAKVSGGNTNYNNLKSAELLALYGFNNKKEEVGSTQTTGGFESVYSTGTLNPEEFYDIRIDVGELSKSHKE